MLESQIPTTKTTKAPRNKADTKTPRDSSFLTRKVVMPEMLNPNGTLFGGVIMSWIDEVAFMTARRYSGRPFVVTASIDNITFLMPLRNGDHVLLTSQVNYVGRTSMEIGVKVEREDPFTGEATQATSAYLTFVALDENGKPADVPQLKLENEEDERRFEEALIRVKVRSRMKAHLKRKVELNRNRKNSNRADLETQTSDAPKTSEHDNSRQRHLLFIQMANSVKDVWERYQKFSRLKVRPKDLKKLLRMPHAPRSNKS